MEHLTTLCVVGALAAAALSVPCALAQTTAPSGPTAEVVAMPPLDGSNVHYPTSRAPLQPTPFIKLPVGAITPAGWTRRALELQRDGLTGHLGEISIWLTKKNNAWLNKSGQGEYGWEEVPYWLKGYVRIAYMLNDPGMIKESKVWLDGTLASQRDDGDFGPIVTKQHGRDLWAQMLMLNTLQSFYEATNDPRVLPFMTRYFQWQLAIPDDKFLRDYWENSRGGDNLASVYWLYDRTGDKFLLELATKIDKNTANWRQADEGKLPNTHGVNVAQCFREPAEYYLQSKKQSDLKATRDVFDLYRDRYGNVPGGMFAADENARDGLSDPRQAAETCAMVEQMGSNELLLQITGNPKWADNLEDVAYNTYPAAFTPDYKALRYLTAPNMAVSDSADHSPGIQNGGPFLLMNPFSSRCCQHNHTSGWPNYLEATWMATPDNGLAAQVYSAGTVRASVGPKRGGAATEAGAGGVKSGGGEVSIVTDTHYPFEEDARLTIQTQAPVAFPLYLRIPAWAKGATVAVNDQPVKIAAAAGQYVKLVGQWNDGDRVTIHLPMALSVKTWKKNKDSVSIDYGPLTFSLKIDEKYEKTDSLKTAIHDSGWQPDADPAKWPSFEILPGSAWNYGLLIDKSDPAGSLTVERHPWPKDDNPFTNVAAPITIKAQGKKLPDWKLDQYELVSPLPQSPVDPAGPAEPITLVPMGGARLRISAFPTVK